jgi:hypothetical protein
MQEFATVAREAGESATTAMIEDMEGSRDAYEEAKSQIETGQAHLDELKHTIADIEAQTLAREQFAGFAQYAE